MLDLGAWGICLGIGVLKRIYEEVYWVCEEIGPFERVLEGPWDGTGHREVYKYRVGHRLHMRLHSETYEVVLGYLGHRSRRANQQRIGMMAQKGYRYIGGDMREQDKSNGYRKGT